jgi:hypothetical protein
MGRIRLRAAFTRSLSAIRFLTAQLANAVCTASLAPDCPSKRSRHDPRASSWRSGILPEGRVPERPVSRVLFRRGVAPAPAKIIPLGRPLLAGSSTLTRTPRLDRSRDDRADRSRRCPYSSLLREGLAPPPVTRLSRVGSYPTISPLPVPSEPGHRRCRFCGAFPRVTPGRRYRPPCPMEPGLSSRERCLFTGDLPAASGGRTHPIAGGRPGQRVAGLPVGIKSRKECLFVI